MKKRIRIIFTAIFTLALAIISFSTLALAKPIPDFAFNYDYRTRFGRENRGSFEATLLENYGDPLPEVDLSEVASSDYPVSKKPVGSMRYSCKKGDKFTVKIEVIFPRELDDAVEKELARIVFQSQAKYVEFGSVSYDVSGKNVTVSVPVTVRNSLKHDVYVYFNPIHGASDNVFDWSNNRFILEKK